MWLHREILAGICEARGLPLHLYTILEERRIVQGLFEANWESLGQSAAELCLISFVMAAFSTRPNIVSCSGSTLETINLIDNSPYSKHGLQRPLRFDDFSIAKLMHKQCLWANKLPLSLEVPHHLLGWKFRL